MAAGLLTGASVEDGALFTGGAGLASGPVNLTGEGLKLAQQNAGLLLKHGHIQFGRKYLERSSFAQLDRTRELDVRDTLSFSPVAILIDTCSS